MTIRLMQQSFMRASMEKNVETIEGMQPTLYHVNREMNEIGDIHLNSAFVCEETQPTPEDNVKTPPKSGTSTATSNDCASLQPGTSKREKEKRLGTLAEQILHQR